MVPLAELWLPILLSAVVVFVASSIIHMVLPYHKNDFRPVPDEDRLMDALRPSALPRGEYMVPYCESREDMSSPEYLEKMEKGPVALITVLPSGPTRMGRTLALWFLYLLVVSYVAAYVASRAVLPGAEYGEAFRFAGTTAFAAYAIGLAQPSIWYGRTWGNTLKSMFDGVVYALLTGGVFGWLWP